MWIVIECRPHKTELRARGAVAAIVWMLIILAMGWGLGWIISS